MGSKENFSLGQLAPCLSHPQAPLTPHLYITRKSYQSSFQICPIPTPHPSLSHPATIIFCLDDSSLLTGLPTSTQASHSRQRGIIKTEIGLCSSSTQTLLGSSSHIYTRLPGPSWYAHHVFYLVFYTLLLLTLLQPPGHLAVLGSLQISFHPRAFAGAVSSAWNALPQSHRLLPLSSQWDLPWPTHLEFQPHPILPGPLYTNTHFIFS